MSWLVSLLKALPFSNGAMLLWGLAAALPIIIHLWSKRKYQEVTWAAMEFLLAAVRKNARRIRIEQLLLLAVRVAILLLLALALADPLLNLFPSLAGSLGAGGDTHFVLVIDGSYSMDYRPGDAGRPGEKTRFQLARELAGQVIENSRLGDGFTLVLMADPPEIVIGEPAFDPTDVAEELENLRLRHAGAPLPPALSAIEQIVESAQEKQPRLIETRVCLFTDLGQTTWNDAALEEIRPRLSRLGESAAIVLFDVGQPGAENTAITRLESRDSLVTLARSATIEAEIQNFGAEDQRGQRVEFLVDGQTVHETSVDVPAGGPVTVSFEHRFTLPGEHSVEARLSDDALAVDNRRWLSVPVRETIRVLAIEGRPGAARHLALALQPETSDRPRVRVETRGENTLAETDLSSFDCVLLANVARFSREEAGVLHDFVAAGGGLIVVLGDQVQIDSYNQELGGSVVDRSAINRSDRGAISDTRRLLPAKLLELAATDRYFFDPLQYRHPIVEPFRGFEQSGLLLTPIWKYVRVQPDPAGSARVAVAFQNGDPAIVDETIERGRVVLLTTAASPDSLDRTVSPPLPWTAFSTWPSFPPLVQEMLSVAVQGRSLHRNLQVGEPIDGVLHGAVADVPLSIVSPDGQSERVRMRIEGDQSRWTFDGTAWSGLYQASFGPPLNTTQVYALNVDPRESNLERFDPEMLPSQIFRDVPADHDPLAAAATRPAAYFRYLLGAVLILVLLETFLAWRFGGAAG